MVGRNPGRFDRLRTKYIAEAKCCDRNRCLCGTSNGKKITCSFRFPLRVPAMALLVCVVEEGIDICFRVFCFYSEWRPFKTVGSVKMLNFGGGVGGAL